jgi:hypothetical protein
MAGIKTKASKARLADIDAKVLEKPVAQAVKAKQA